MISPRGEGERYHDAENFSISIAVTDPVSFANQTRENRDFTQFNMRRMILPLPGERAGVRADVISEFLFIPFHPLKLSRTWTILRFEKHLPKNI